RRGGAGPVGGLLGGKVPTGREILLQLQQLRKFGPEAAQPSVLWLFFLSVRSPTISPASPPSLKGRAPALPPCWRRGKVPGRFQWSLPERRRQGRRRFWRRPVKWFWVRQWPGPTV